MEHFYDYQNECIKACMDDTFGRIILPTGSGKTVIALDCIKNIALSKENFAIAVYNNDIKISNDSWENFRHIFKKIEEILK